MAGRLITLPRQIACVGRNYLSHIKELSNVRPSEPFFFLKPPASILQPGAGPVLIPRDACIHHEVELGVVIGRDVDEVSAEEVRQEEEEFKHGRFKGEGIVGGYFVGIDLTSRVYQDRAKKAGLPWTYGKCLKTFLPVSPFIPREVLPAFPDKSNDVIIHLEVNGQERQNDSPVLMLADIPTLIQTISSVFPLYKGDLLLTGTPKGVAEVVGGDVMTAGIRVAGKEIDEGKIEVPVEWRVGGYGSSKL